MIIVKRFHCMNDKQKIRMAIIENDETEKKKG